MIFQKKMKFWAFWEFFRFRSHSTASLLQFSEKLTAPSDVNSMADFGVKAIGKQRVKKNFRIEHLRTRFLLYIFDTVQNKSKLWKFYLPLCFQDSSGSLFLLHNFGMNEVLEFV